MAIHNICVFCGSNSGLDSKFSEKTAELGAYLAQNDYQLIYGGGTHGWMAAGAQAALEHLHRHFLCSHFLLLFVLYHKMTPNR